MLFLFSTINHRATVGSTLEVQPSDSALVQAAQADPTAFTQLYDRYLERVYAYCHVRLHRHEAAEDATSEIFLKAFAALPRYRDQMFAAWLFKIAHNVVINIQRQQRPRSDVELSELPDPQPSLEQALIEDADWQALWAGLAQLPDEQRTVLELACVGLSGAEIAATMGKSNTAVRMIRHRAIAKLKQLVNP